MSMKTLQLERDLIDAGVRERALEAELEAVKAKLSYVSGELRLARDERDKAWDDLEAVKAERDEAQRWAAAANEGAKEFIKSQVDASRVSIRRAARREALQEAAKVAAEAYWSGVSITEAIQALIDAESKS